MPFIGKRKTMPPPTPPPYRQWPQTLLLIILALLIAAATIMLACEQAAPPAPSDGDALPMAQQVSGGSEEPAADPTATPTTEPTATPTPYPTLCIAMPEEYQDLTELGENHVRRYGFLYYCFVETPLPPIPTPKYPQLGDQLSRYAQEAEAAQAQAKQAAGASEASEVEIPLVYLHIVLAANTEEVVAWLQRNGIPLSEDWVEGDRGYIGAYRVDWEFGDDFIYAFVPATLLVALSQQEGITYMEDVGYLLHIEEY